MTNARLSVALCSGVTLSGCVPHRPRARPGLLSSPSILRLTSRIMISPTRRRVFAFDISGRGRSRWAPVAVTNAAPLIRAGSNARSTSVSTRFPWSNGSGDPAEKSPSTSFHMQTEMGALGSGYWLIPF